MRKVFEGLLEELNAGCAAVVATITKSNGSTPRKAGSQMLVREDGSIAGTVGGGAVEYRTILAGQEALAQKTSFARDFSLSRSQAADIGMVCGGQVEIYLQYLEPRPESIRLCEDILSAMAQDAACFLVLDITVEDHWKAALTKENPAIIGGKEERRYAIPLVEAGIVYIFGGGHVAQELVPVLVHLDFRCIVIDDRAEFSCPEVFPQAEQTLVSDLEDLDGTIAVRPCDYACIMTRGHQYDYYIQKQMLRAKPCYIGIMGSRNKIRVVTERLMQDGFSRAEIETCHMPVGIDIKAETPAEIAISIAGELIAARAARRKR